MFMLKAVVAPCGGGWTLRRLHALIEMTFNLPGHFMSVTHTLNFLLTVIRSLPIH